MNLKTEVWFLPRPATNYPGCFPLHLEERIPKILGTKNFIHLFSGSCRLGHTIDLREEIKCYSFKDKKHLTIKPKTVCNVEELPFEDNTFEGGFADPPYNKEYAKKLYNCKYARWRKWGDELVRVVKPGGLIIVFHYHFLPPLPNCKYEKLIIVIMRKHHTLRLLNIFRKNGKKQITLEDFR